MSLALSRVAVQSSHHTTERHFGSTKSSWKMWSRTSSRSKSWLPSPTSISCAVTCLCLRDVWWYVIQSSEPQWSRVVMMPVESRERRGDIGVLGSEENVDEDKDSSVAMVKSCSATRNQLLVHGRPFIVSVSAGSVTNMKGGAGKLSCEQWDIGDSVEITSREHFRILTCNGIVH